MKLNLDSEYAAVKVSSEICTLFPKAWARPANSQLPSNILYFYQQYIDGEAAFGIMISIPPITDPAIRLIRNYAAFMIQLEKLSFDKVGSLRTADDGSFQVGPCLERLPVLQHPPYFLGPFGTAKQRYLAVINARVGQTLQGARHAPSMELLHYLILLDLKSYVSDCPAAILTCKAEVFAAPTNMTGTPVIYTPIFSPLQKSIISKTAIEHTEVCVAEGMRVTF
ncbi:hypothetical protein IAR55_002190 [Kwoniella newhampshirensis]|uniref:Uncharacterized protein n=1 Tax=Kwoniella newhampshirensis TaxID=1651941 RepID=A0AAW0Z0P6_9TREE